MSNRKIAVLRIEESHANAPLSPAQKKFNATLKKINAQKKLLAAW
jgi:hypothetical protein